MSVRIRVMGSAPGEGTFRVQAAPKTGAQPSSAHRYAHVLGMLIFKLHTTPVLELQDGETVTRALKRLGTHTVAKARPGKRQPSSSDAGQTQPSEEEKKESQAKFDRLTEAASALMDSGDLDVYCQDKVTSLQCCAVVQVLSLIRCKRSIAPSVLLTGVVANQVDTEFAAFQARQ